jgi:hypothetical protein
MTRLCAFALLCLALQPQAAQAQDTTTAAPKSPPLLWFVGGAGFTVARAGCPECPEEGTYTQGGSLLVNAGFRINARLDIGAELVWASSKFQHEGESILTTFVLGVAQVRPWEQHGFFFKAGMGVGFVGNGLYSPIGPALEPPFTTNTLALMYGAGWVTKRERRVAFQVHATHHVAALGELRLENQTSIKNVVANHWTLGAGVIFRR